MMKTQKETFLDFDLEMQFSPGQNASSDRRGGGGIYFLQVASKIGLQILLVTGTVLPYPQIRLANFTSYPQIRLENFTSSYPQIRLENFTSYRYPQIR